MQAAWLTFAAFGRREHADLRIVFAMLAGGPLTFYESSSYGPVALWAMRNRVGAGQLLYGSDRPVLEPSRTGWDAALKANAARLLASVPAGAPAVAA
jgi:hypothetical protein